MPTSSPVFLQQFASPPHLMVQARRSPVKKRKSSRSNSSPPISSPMLSIAVERANPVLACGRTVSQPAPTQ